MAGALASHRNAANNGVFLLNLTENDSLRFQMWENFAWRGMKKWSFSTCVWKFPKGRI